MFGVARDDEVESPLVIELSFKSQKGKRSVYCGENINGWAGLDDSLI